PPSADPGLPSAHEPTGSPAGSRAGVPRGRPRTASAPGSPPALRRARARRAPDRGAAPRRGGADSAPRALRAPAAGGAARRPYAGCVGASLPLSDPLTLSSRTSKSEALECAAETLAYHPAQGVSSRVVRLAVPRPAGRAHCASAIGRRHSIQLAGGQDVPTDLRTRVGGGRAPRGAGPS